MEVKAERSIVPALWGGVLSILYSVGPVAMVAAVAAGSASGFGAAGNAARASSSSFCTSLTLSGSRVHWSSGPSSARRSSTVCSSSGLWSVVAPPQVAVEAVLSLLAPRPLNFWKRAARSLSMLQVAEMGAALESARMSGLGSWSGIMMYCRTGSLHATYFDACKVMLDFFKALRRARRLLSWLDGSSSITGRHVAWGTEETRAVRGTFDITYHRAGLSSLGFEIAS